MYNFIVLLPLNKVCTLAEIQTAVLSNQTEDLSEDLDRLATWPRSKKGCMTRLRDATKDNVLLNSRHSLGSNSGTLTHYFLAPL